MQALQQLAEQQLCRRTAITTNASVQAARTAALQGLGDVRRVFRAAAYGELDPLHNRIVSADTTAVQTLSLTQNSKSEMIDHRNMVHARIRYAATTETDHPSGEHTRCTTHRRQHTQTQHGWHKMSLITDTMNVDNIYCASAAICNSRQCQQRVRRHVRGGRVTQDELVRS